MFRISPIPQMLKASLALAFTLDSAVADVTMPSSSGAPRVNVQVASRAAAPHLQQAPRGPTSRVLYPWKTRVTSTIFWVGEQPTDRNPVPNTKSSWDQNWTSNFGGYDDPEPTNRMANFATGEFRPKNFVPKLNPFYVALPYNDVQGYGSHKPEAARVIPWFSRIRPEPGHTVCKGRWVQIYNGSRSCYAQWEDCGPWVTDDWEFVFGTKPPKTTQNGAAGIDLSPSIRDYLALKSGQKVHWRFIEASQVPHGPWKKYGKTSPPTNSANSIAQQKYLEYMRKLRDEQYQRRSASQVKN